MARKGPRSLARVPMSRFISPTQNRVPATACQGWLPGAARPRVREPITMSAWPARMGATTSGNCAGWSLWSPSRKTITSAVSPRAAIPVRHACPYPRRGSTTTRAPAARATSAVRSREPLSTTTTSATSGRTSATTRPMACSSSRAGMTTPMRNPERC